MQVIKDREINPKINKVDKSKWYNRKTAKTYKGNSSLVTVPEEKNTQEDEEETTHHEIQYILLKLGSDLGLDVWVARNDRNKNFEGNYFKDIPRLREEIPKKFNEATNKTIELIDVLWLKEDSIVAAFEVEHTTTIYSGLLRMSDLNVMQPNLKIDLYIVAPEKRREKVIEEINRPTFSNLEQPLTDICKFIPYLKLKRAIKQHEEILEAIKENLFLDMISEDCRII